MISALLNGSDYKASKSALSDGGRVYACTLFETDNIMRMGHRIMDPMDGKLKKRAIDTDGSHNSTLLFEKQNKTGLQ